MATARASPRQITGRPCSVCQHPQRPEIDRAFVAGEPVPKLSARFGLSKPALHRHMANHVPTDAMAAGAAERAADEGVQGVDLLARAARLLRDAEQILDDAKAEGDRVNAIRAIREASRVIEVIGKLQGAIDTSTTINIAMAPAMLELQAVVLMALAEYPQARMAVADALGRINGPAAPRLIEHQP